MKNLKFKFKGYYILYILGALILGGGFFLYTKTDNWTAKSPRRIIKEAGYSLPAYRVIETGNNMDRGSSSFSWYYWKIKTKKPLSKKEIKKLKKLAAKDPNWHNEGDSFNYVTGGHGGSDKSIKISIEKNGEISMRYEWRDFFF